MNTFTYRSQAEKDNIEEILRSRKKKFNRQQLISALIIAAVLLAFVLYVGFHVYYTEYDGYVHVDANKVRTPFDIYLDSVYVKEGDIVGPGDTLYSYYNIDMLLDQANPATEPAFITHGRDLTLRYQNVAQQIAVLRTQIAELQKQIAVENHNISFGLSSNSHKLDLERELNIARSQLQALLAELGTIGRLRNQAAPSSALNSWGFGSNGRLAQQIYDDNRSLYLRELICYHLMSDSSIVTQVMAPKRMVFFEKEEIMTTQHLDLEGNNLQVVAYIPIDKMHRITNRSKAEVVVNDDFSFRATVSVLGLRTDVIPENLRSYFSKKNTALIAVLTIDDGQTLPFWTMASGLPVRVRVRNTDTWGEEATAENYLWYTTGKGIKIDMDKEWKYRTSRDSVIERFKLKKDSVKPKRNPKPDSVKPQAVAPAAAQPQTKPQAQTQPQTKVETQPKSNADSAKPKAEAKAAPQPAQKSKIAFRYVVVAGTFKNAEKAQLECERLAKMHPDLAAQFGVLALGSKNIIYVGSYTERQQAQDQLVPLRKRKALEEVWVLDTQPSQNP